MVSAAVERFKRYTRRASRVCLSKWLFSGFQSAIVTGIFKSGDCSQAFMNVGVLPVFVTKNNATWDCFPLVSATKLQVPTEGVRIVSTRPVAAFDHFWCSKPKEPAPSPSPRCINTLSNHRPNLNPTDRNSPAGTNLKLACSPIDAALSLPPITATICPIQLESLNHRRKQ